MTDTPRQRLKVIAPTEPIGLPPRPGRIVVDLNDPKRMLVFLLAELSALGYQVIESDQNFAASHYQKEDPNDGLTPPKPTH